MTHCYFTDVLPGGDIEFRSRETNGHYEPVSTGYYSDRTGILTFCTDDGAEDIYDGLDSLDEAQDLYGVLLEEQARDEARAAYFHESDLNDRDLDSHQLSPPTRPELSWYRSVLSFLCPSATLS